AVGLVTLANLRGIRESGSIFAAPTYVFLAAMFSMVGVGLYLYFTGQFYVPPPANLPPPVEPLTLFLLLRAFAVGSAVMTGTEAISNGIPAFKPPESRNAAQTIVIMAGILAQMFLGLSFLIVGCLFIPRPAATRARCCRCTRSPSSPPSRCRRRAWSSTGDGSGVGTGCQNRSSTASVPRRPAW